MAATSRGWCVVLAMGLVLAAASAVVSAVVTIGDDAGGLSLDFHAASCPQLEGIVRASVQAARGQDVQVTAGLLRIFFHDCLPQQIKQYCKLIEDIRAKVHARCGPTVSCADIIAFATRDAVTLAGGPSFAMPQGRTDSLRPATSGEIGLLPSPFSDVNTLLGAFSRRGLADPADLVGKAGCSSIRGNDDFSRRIAALCARTSSRKQSLDIITPDAFDNRYFVAVKNARGVLLSDHVLAGDQRTARLRHRLRHQPNRLLRAVCQVTGQAREHQGSRRRDTQQLLQAQRRPWCQPRRRY